MVEIVKKPRKFRIEDRVYGELEMMDADRPYLPEKQQLFFIQRYSV